MNLARVHSVRFLVISLLFWGFSATAQAADPPVTQDTVDAAIDKGVEYLLSRRNEWGHWEAAAVSDDREWGGRSSLVLLALLTAGKNPREAPVSDALSWLSAQTLRGTYAYGLRAQVFALTGEKHRGRLSDDLKWLLEAAYTDGGAHPGAYTYETLLGRKDAREYDNSNSQFGVIGAWFATEADATALGIEDYWKRVETHWLAEQNTDGGWGYQNHVSSSGSMTAAGLTSLYVLLDRVHSRTGHKNAVETIAAINRGLDWFGREFTTENPHGDSGYKFYYLYGVERVGRASGRKYFRDKDWFKLGAAELLRRQGENGAWSGGVIETAFAVLFLSHGRAPLLYNKLEHGDDWDNYLRDVAGLDRYAQHALERLLNWQIVSLDGTIDDLLEAPVLYLGGRTAWTFSDAQLDRLREYSDRGGLIFAVAEQGSPEFRKGMEELAGKLWPTLKLRPMRKSHPLLSGRVQYAIDRPPPLSEVADGVRTRLLLCGEDLARNWNEYQLKKGRRDFELGVNVYLYATDKSAPRSRLATSTIALEPAETPRTIKLARIRHDGVWNPAPYGWERQRIYMNNTSHTKLELSDGIAFDAPELSQFRVAHICGVDALKLSQPEIAGLRRFLTSGGTLLADCLDGSNEFRDSLEEAVANALKVEPRALSPKHPIITGDGLADSRQLDSVSYRRSVRAAARGEPPPLMMFEAGGRVAVLYSPYDISTSLLGVPVWGLRGYESQSALRVMRNMLLYANLSSDEKVKLKRE